MEKTNVSIRQLVCGALLLGACATDGSLGRLEAKHQQQVSQLKRIEGEIAVAEQRAVIARRHAEFQECRAQRSFVNALVNVEQSECLASVANFNACGAANSSGTAKSTTVGCVFGIAAALLTSGGASSFALVGCGMGHVAGSTSETDCDAPTCTPDRSALLEEVLARQNLSELPHCGGYLGLSLKRGAGESVTGLGVSEVGANTTARLAGIQSGDVVFAINGTRLSGAAHLAEILSRIAPGSSMTIDFERGGEILRGRTSASRIDFYGKLNKQVVLGFTRKNKLVKVRLPGHPEVAAITEGGAGGLAGIEIGDRLVRVGELAVTSPGGVVDALSRIPAGSNAAISILRGQVPLTIQVTLSESR